MVPTARLELARPRSLPPQDSVSTNSTTSAKGLSPFHCAGRERVRLRFYCGMSAALEPSSGAVAGVTGAAGWVVVGTPVRSSTLLEGLFCCNP